MEPYEFQHLADRIRTGADSDAEKDEFCRELHRLLRRKVLSIAITSGLEAEDLMQEVILHILKALPKMPSSIESYVRWLFTVAHRRCVDELRKHKRLPPLLTLNDEEGVKQVDGRAVSEYTQVVIKAEERESFDRALERLDAECRDLLRLHMALVLSRAEGIGGGGRTSDRDRKRLSRCRGTLREIYQRMEAHHG